MIFIDICKLWLKGIIVPAYRIIITPLGEILKEGGIYGIVKFF